MSVEVDAKGGMLYKTIDTAKMKTPIVMVFAGKKLMHISIRLPVNTCKKAQLDTPRIARRIRGTSLINKHVRRERESAIDPAWDVRLARKKSKYVYTRAYPRVSQTRPSYNDTARRVPSPPNSVSNWWCY